MAEVDKRNQSLSSKEANTNADSSTSQEQDSNEANRERNRALMVKLQRNILKSFPKKTFIGDIPITDEEFKLLIFYLRIRYKKMRASGIHICNDPILCAALVQIGMRYYDGKYWPHVRRLLNDPSFSSNQQGWLGGSFVDTMRRNDKLRISFSDKVNAILMHCFVTNQYSNRFFDFLYTFYTIDLDRDITRLDRNVMNSLIETIKRNDNRGRTYFLVEQTADAVRQNERGAKTRIRYYLKLIDKAFWGDPLPENSKNRLVQRFMEWKNSAVFIQERERYASGGKRGRKSFSTPYLKYSGNLGYFSLVIPEQILAFREFGDVRWVIESEHYTGTIPINPYAEAVTGYKTESETLLLPQNCLFDSFSISLMDNDERLKSFCIVKDVIRFFDEDGYFIRNDALPQGTVYSFTELGLYPKSEALIESVDNGEYIHSTFDFVTGDIVIVPGGKPISVGGTIKEGMLPRGKVDGVIAGASEEIWPVYKAVPQVLIRMQPQRAAGTALSVNGKMYHLSLEGNENGVSEFDLLDRSGERGYLVDLSAFGCKSDGEYSVVVSVPNDRTIRQWKFVLIRYLEFEFEDAPYIFKTRGTLKMPPNSRFKAKGEIREETTDFKRFDFDIVPGESRLYLDYMGTDIGFALPTFSYRFHGEDWMTEPHVDIWRGDFEPRLEIAYDADRITFFLDDVGDDEAGDHPETFSMIKSKGVFECDLNRFKSWFGRECVIRTIYMQLPGIREAIPFVRVVTKSVFVSGLIRADYQNNRMIGEVDVIGYSDYSVDVLFEKQLLFEKVRLENKSFNVESELRTGVYTVVLYEAEEDESGFGDVAYYEVGRFSSSLLNPTDLSGMSIEISRIHPADDTVSYLPLDYSYQIVYLDSVDECHHEYLGKMIVSNRRGVAATFPVKVDFFDLNRLQQAYITFSDEGDFCEFLYDEYGKAIVKQENTAMTKSQAYRRYNISLYPEDFVFDVKFVEDPKNMDIEVDDKDYNNLRIKQNFLKKIMTESIFEKNTKQPPKQEQKPRRGGLAWRSHQ